MGLAPRLALLAWIACGCASPSETKPTPALEDPAPARLAAAEPSGDERVGIEVRQWLVAAPPERLAAALEAWAFDDSTSTIDGLTLATGPIADLPTFLEQLGGTRTDLRVWHGQATDWRDLAGVNLPRSMVAMIEGRPHPVPPGRLALKFRGWVQPVEDGASCEVELGIRWKPERRVSIALAERPDADLVWVGSLARRIELRRGTVLLVSSAPPPAAPETGPPVAVPPSLGRIILPEPAHGLATVLVVWPSLPGWLFPHATAGGETIGTASAD